MNLGVKELISGSTLFHAAVKSGKRRTTIWTIYEITKSKIATKKASWRVSCPEIDLAHLWKSRMKCDVRHNIGVTSQAMTKRAAPDVVQIRLWCWGRNRKCLLTEEKCQDGRVCSGRKGVGSFYRPSLAADEGSIFFDRWRADFESSDKLHNPLRFVTPAFVMSFLKLNVWPLKVRSSYNGFLDYLANKCGEFNTEEGKKKETRKQTATTITSKDILQSKAQRVVVLRGASNSKRSNDRKSLTDKSEISPIGFSTTEALFCFETWTRNATHQACGV